MKKEDSYRKDNQGGDEGRREGWLWLPPVYNLSQIICVLWSNIFKWNHTCEYNSFNGLKKKTNRICDEVTDLQNTQKELLILWFQNWVIFTCIQKNLFLFLHYFKNKFKYKGNLHSTWWHTMQCAIKLMWLLKLCWKVV